MKNIHILPTDKPSRLHYYRVVTKTDIIYKLVLKKEFSKCEDNGIYSEQRNIYITSDEKIKKGDWITQINFEKTNTQIKQCVTELQIKIANDKNGCFIRNKIILTTDQDLIKDGVQPIPDEFLEWFVNNSNCESVEVNKICNNCGDINCIHSICRSQIAKTKEETYKISIPKEKSKQRVVCTNIICQGECGECNFMTTVNVKNFKQETLKEIIEKKI